MKSILIILITLFFTSEFTGKVVGVHDGDTITVLVENEQVKVRLEGIDCPELKQAFGQRAKQACSDLCFGKIVTVKETGKDRYGRTLGFVYADGVFVNSRLLELGMAWHYKKYNQDPEMAQLEKTAKSNKTGLWADKNAVAPWEWRKKK